MLSDKTKLQHAGLGYESRIGLGTCEEWHLTITAWQPTSPLDKVALHLAHLAHAPSLSKNVFFRYLGFAVLKLEWEFRHSCQVLRARCRRMVNVVYQVIHSTYVRIHSTAHSWPTSHENSFRPRPGGVRSSSTLVPGKNLTTPLHWPLRETSQPNFVPATSQPCKWPRL